MFIFSVVPYFFDNFLVPSSLMDYISTCMQHQLSLFSFLSFMLFCLQSQIMLGMVTPQVVFLFTACIFFFIFLVFLLCVCVCVCVFVIDRR